MEGVIFLPNTMYINYPNSQSWHRTGKTGVNLWSSADPQPHD